MQQFRGSVLTLRVTTQHRRAFSRINLGGKTLVRARFFRSKRAAAGALTRPAERKAPQSLTRNSPVRILSACDIPSRRAAVCTLRACVW